MSRRLNCQKAVLRIETLESMELTGKVNEDYKKIVNHIVNIQDNQKLLNLLDCLAHQDYLFKPAALSYVGLSNSDRSYYFNEKGQKCSETWAQIERLFVNRLLSNALGDKGNEGLAELIDQNPFLKQHSLMITNGQGADKQLEVPALFSKLTEERAKIWQKAVFEK